MKIVFRGVRGSLPTPYAENLEYGGNTACVEIRSSSGDIVALDGGTGLRDVGLALTEEFGREGMEIDILLSHYHWDHIQGIPFFDPLFVSGNRVRFFGHGDHLHDLPWEVFTAREWFGKRIARGDALGGLVQHIGQCHIPRSLFTDF